MKKNLRNRIENDPELARLSDDIRALQAELRKSASDASWNMYLRIEETSNARLIRVEDLCVEHFTSEADGPDEEA